MSTWDLLTLIACAWCLLLLWHSERDKKRIKRLEALLEQSEREPGGSE